EAAGQKKLRQCDRRGFTAENKAKHEVDEKDENRRINDHIDLRQGRKDVGGRKRPKLEQITERQSESEAGRDSQDDQESDQVSGVLPDRSLGIVEDRLVKFQLAICVAGKPFAESTEEVDQANDKQRDDENAYGNYEGVGKELPEIIRQKEVR